MSVPPSLVDRVTEGLKQPVLVLTDADVPGVPPSPPFGAVVLAASDLSALRGMLDDLPALGRARMVGVVLAEAGAPVPLRVRPSWPALVDLDARTEGEGAVTVAKFAARVDVAEVLAGIAYAAGGGGHGGLVVGRAYDPDDKVPPDVLVGAAARPVPASPVRESPVPESPVLGRAPAVVADPGPAPLDETLFNPCGFRREWSRGVVDLDPSWSATPGLVSRLRDAQGVRVAPGADRRVLAALTMSGVPLVEAGGEGVLDDADRREELSVRQRRDALREHSTYAWRARLAGRAGLRPPAEPTVTVAPDLSGDLVLALPDGQEPGPELVADLLLARRYSGADLVGAGTAPTERYGAVGAGDPVLVDRSWCRLVGTDPAALLAAVRATGGTDYRTHAGARLA